MNQFQKLVALIKAKYPNAVVKGRERCDRCGINSSSDVKSAKTLMSLNKDGYAKED